MRLYELPARFQEIESLAIDGELTDEHLAKLAELEGTLAEKVQSSLCVSRNFAARAAARKAEADRLSALAKSDAANEERLKKYVEGVLLALNVDKVETDLFKVRIQANPPKVVIAEGFDLSTLPDEWLNPPKPREANKKAILAASKDAPLPEGVSIVQEKSLRVS